MEPTVKQFVEMLKAGKIKLSDVPKRHKVEVCKIVYGRYPLTSLKDLNIVKK